MEILIEYLAKGFVVMLMVSLPCVLVAAGIGLVVGILQAVTQVQEQTIAAAPKILCVFLTIIILGGWYTKTLTDFLIEGTGIAFNVVPKSDNYVLPPDYYKHTKPFIKEFYEGPGALEGKIKSSPPHPSEAAKTGEFHSGGPAYEPGGANLLERMQMNKNRQGK